MVIIVGKRKTQKEKEEENGGNKGSRGSGEGKKWVIEKILVELFL